MKHPHLLPIWHSEPQDLEERSQGRWSWLWSWLRNIGRDFSTSQKVFWALILVGALLNIGAILDRRINGLTTSTLRSNEPLPLRTAGSDNKEHMSSSSSVSYGSDRKFEKTIGGFFTLTSVDGFYFRETSFETCVRPITGELHVRPVTPAHGGEKPHVLVHLLLSSSDPNPTSPPEIEKMQTKSGIAFRRTDPCNENLKIHATIWISLGTSLIRHLSITTHSLSIIFHQNDNNHSALRTSGNFDPNTVLPLSLPRQTNRTKTENTTPGAPSKSSPPADASTELTPSTTPSPAKSTDTSLLDSSTHQHPVSGDPLNPSTAPSGLEASAAPPPPPPSL